MEPANGGAVARNQTLTFVFDDGIAGGQDWESLVSIRPEDPEQEPASGFFVAEGNRLHFRPQVPRRADLADAGLAADTLYLVEVFGPPRFQTLRSASGRNLSEGFRRAFRTLAPDQPEGAALPGFLDPSPNTAPRLVMARESSGGFAGVRLLDGHCRLRFSEPLDPVVLAGAEFRLLGPWSLSMPPQGRSDLDPLLDWELIENQGQAVLELTIPALLPAPLRPEERYWITLDRECLRDLGGHPLDYDSREVPIVQATGDSPDPGAAEALPAPVPPTRISGTGGESDHRQEE
jgi:hypothetical protein